MKADPPAAKSHCVCYLQWFQFKLTCVIFAVLAAAVCIPDSSRGEEPAVSAADLLDLSLEELSEVRVASVFGASRYEQTVGRAPASVSVVTADEIRKFGHRTLSDVLRGVRGMYVSNDRNYSYLGIRGFLRPGDFTTRVLMLVDGHRMNDNVYDGIYFGYENTIDLDLIERIEIIRGPSSSLYGSSAFLGVINIITKRGGKAAGGELSVAGGSFDTYQGRFHYGTTLPNGVDLLFSGFYRTSDGMDELYFREFDQRKSDDPRAGNNGIVRNFDGEEVFNFYFKARYNDLTLTGFFSQRDKQVPTASYGSAFNVGMEETRDRRAFLDLKHTYSFDNGSTLQSRIFLDQSYYYAVYPFDYEETGLRKDIVRNIDKSIGEWAGLELQLTNKILEKHTLILGGEYRENLRQYQINYDDVSPRANYSHDDRTSRTMGLFAQAEIALGDTLLLNAGLRYDHYFASFGDTLNPRLGLIFNPWDGGTFKLLYGQAFRAPNVYEQHYYQEQAALPKLDPETIRTYELAYEHEFQKDYRFGVSIYHYEIDDLINMLSTPEGDLGFANIGEVTALGVEFGIEARYESGLMARASYALQRTEDRDGHELSNSPRHLAKLNILLPLYKEKIFGGLELQYTSSAETVRGNRAADHLITNINLFSRRIANNWEVSAGVQNLFDVKYEYPGGEDHLQDTILQDGRSFLIKITRRF